MKDEYIRKQDAVDAFNRAVQDVGILDADDIETVFEMLSSADVMQVVHSQWKYKCGEIRCPECGNRIHRIDLSGYLNFCPNCGAKMDAQGEE